MSCRSRACGTSAGRGAPARHRARPGREAARGRADMGGGTEVVARIYARLDGAEWLGRLAVRLSVGLMFFGSGLGKLGKLPRLIEYFRSLGIPAPELQAPVVASVEFVCGALLVVGLATRPAALML